MPEQSEFKSTRPSDMHPKAILAEIQTSAAPLKAVRHAEGKALRAHRGRLGRR